MPGQHRERMSALGWMPSQKYSCLLRVSKSIGLSLYASSGPISLGCKNVLRASPLREDVRRICSSKGVEFVRQWQTF
jgi:hypothetical protein